MSNFKRIIKTSLIKENPIFSSYLALCPTLGTTSNFNSAIGMGFSVLIVLVLSNTVISSIRKLIPNDIRIPVFITIIATVVTLLEMSMETLMPSLYRTLGIFLPLIVVNCIILGRAEFFASKNSVRESMIDGIVIGISFAISIAALGIFRELFGTGAVNLFSLRVEFFQQETVPSVFIEPTGAFFAFGILSWIFNATRNSSINNKKSIRGV